MRPISQLDAKTGDLVLIVDGKVEVMVWRTLVEEFLPDRPISVTMIEDGEVSGGFFTIAEATVLRDALTKQISAAKKSVG